MDSQNNLHNAEVGLGHNLNLKAGGSLSTGVDDFDGHPVNYKVPDFGIDRDILDSLSNLKNTEAKLGKWKYVANWLKLIINLIGWIAYIVFKWNI